MTFRNVKVFSRLKLTQMVRVVWCDSRQERNLMVVTLEFMREKIISKSITENKIRIN